MSIEGQFIRLPFRAARRELAFVRDRIGKDYLDNIRRFETLERDQEYKLAKRWREHGDRMPRTGLSQVICVSPRKSP
jgi:RNA polymerase sigma-32 factor